MIEGLPTGVKLAGIVTLTQPIRSPPEDVVLTHVAVSVKVVGERSVAVVGAMVSVHAGLSVNVTEADRPDACPSAIALSVEPAQSSSHTCHVVTNPPLESAVADQWSWSSPVEGFSSACSTCSRTSSPGMKPAPVKVAVSPGL